MSIIGPLSYIILPPFLNILCFGTELVLACSQRYIFDSLLLCRNLSDNSDLHGEIPENLLQVAQYKYVNSAMLQTVEYVNYSKFI
jgi:hypothetical protein